ncbi:MAG: YIP1 family protein [Bacillota bacterium]|jgi:hypothetical protein
MSNEEQREEPTAISNSEQPFLPLEATPDSSVPETSATWGWWDLLYGVLFEPTTAFRQITQRRLLGKALLVFLTVQVLSWYMNLILAIETETLSPWLTELPPSLAHDLPRLTTNLTNLTGLTLMSGIIFSLLLWFLGAAIFNLAAEFFGGVSNGSGLLAGLGFAELPGILLLPVQYLAYVFGWGPSLLTVLSLGLGIWVAGLSVITVREATSLSTGRALLVFLLPGLILFGVLLFMLLAFLMILLL